MATSLFLVYTIYIYSTASQYTPFINAVCNTSFTNYSECACTIGNSSAQHDNLDCFTSYNCDYDARTNVFCSGHGTCDFINGICWCDTEYGGEDCGSSYQQFLPSHIILSLMMILGGILLIVSLILILWVHTYRNVSDVKAMSVMFTHLTLVGCASICVGTMVMGQGYNDANCIILEWFQFIGICMVISCALLKSYRIASIFGSDMLSPSDLTDNVLLKYFCVLMFIDIFCLTIYTVFNFVEGGAYIRYIEESLYKEIRCSSDPLSTLSYGLLVSWQLILLLFVIKYGHQTQKASDIFKETQCIYIGSNIGSMCFIAFGIIVLFTTNYTLQIVIRGYCSLFVVSMVIALLFYPKINSVYGLSKRRRSDADDTKSDDDQETEIKRQYEAHVKEPNGKELLLLLDALVKELEYRARMKMLSIELDSIDLIKVDQLMMKLKDLVPNNNKNISVNSASSDAVVAANAAKDAQNKPNTKGSDDEVP